MGYSTEMFVNEDAIDPEFICNICQGVMKIPKMSENCQHIFCNSCIESWMERTTTCPVDRQQIEGLVDPIRAYMNMYNRLEIRCKFDGCTAIRSVEDIEAHHGLCDHDPETSEPCAHDCGAELKRAAIATHSCVAFLKGQLEAKEEAHASETENLMGMFRKRGAEMMRLQKEKRKNDEEILQVRRLNRRNLQEIVELKKIIDRKDSEIDRLRHQMNRRERMREWSPIGRKRPRFVIGCSMTTSDGDTTPEERNATGSEAEFDDEPEDGNHSGSEHDRESNEHGNDATSSEDEETDDEPEDGNAATESEDEPDRDDDDDVIE